MNDRNLVRGLFLLAISLAFGLGSLRYHVGEFSRAGPGLFPLMVSCLLFLIGLITVVRSRFDKPSMRMKIFVASSERATLIRRFVRFDLS